MSNVTMIYVTHDQVEAMTLADRIAVLRDGLLMQVGTPAELYEHPNSLFVAGFIGSPKMNFMTGKFAEAEGCTTLGVRSEHIELVEAGGNWQGRVIHTEDLGSDNYLFVEVGSDEPLIVRQEGKLKVALGATVNLAPKAGMLYRFDADGKPLR
jgi:multiple sugar transport system ATP-binding protein